MGVVGSGDVVMDDVDPHGPIYDGLGKGFGYFPGACELLWDEIREMGV